MHISTERILLVRTQKLMNFDTLVEDQDSHKKEKQQQKCGTGNSHNFQKYFTVWCYARVVYAVIVCSFNISIFYFNYTLKYGIITIRQPFWTPSWIFQNAPGGYLGTFSMLLGIMSRTFPEIFSLLLICLRYKPNAPGLYLSVYHTPIFYQNG